MIGVLKNNPNAKGMIISESGFSRNAKNLADQEKIIIATEIVYETDSDVESDLEELPDKTNNAYHIKVNVRGKEMLGTVDTGATRLTIKYSIAKELRMQLNPSNKRFGTVGQTNADNRGMIEETFYVGDEELKITETLYT